MKSHFSGDFVLAPFQLKNIAVVNSSAKNKVLNRSTPESPGRSRKTEGNPQGSTRRGLATENQEHPR